MSDTNSEIQNPVYNPDVWNRITAKINEYKKNAFLELTDQQQDEYLKLYGIYNKCIMKYFKIFREQLPLEGSTEYNADKQFLSKFGNKRIEFVSELSVFNRARKEFESNKAIIDIKNKSEEIMRDSEETKKQYEEMKKENEEMKRQHEKMKKQNEEMMKNLNYLMKQRMNEGEKDNMININNKRSRVDEIVVIDENGGIVNN
jgi:seryl-tRNA synthetase